MRLSETIDMAYYHALKDVWFNYEYKSSPRGLACREIIDYSFRVSKPEANPIITEDYERNKIIKDYTEKEVELYNSCTNSVEDFAKASKFWNHLANPDGTVNSAYGYLIWKNKSAGSEFETSLQQTDMGMFDVATMRSPWVWALESLKRDKDTRQAILRFSLPEHQWMGNKDQTCTMHGNFLIRDDKLNLSIVMRSNDLMKGLVYDLPWFVSLMDMIIKELKST